MKVRGTKPIPTPRMTKAIDGLKAVIHGQSEKPTRQILREAGYSSESARQMTNVMAGLRPHLKETIAWMEEHRVRIQVAMDRQVDKARYEDLSRALGILTHNIQLLGGKPTANIAIAADVRIRIEQLIEE